MRLTDGRTLAWIEIGDPDGRPVFVFHGTPGSRLEVRPLHAVALDSGLRVIAPDRPGMGGSSFHGNRTLRAWAGDVSALAAHLGLSRYRVLGFSGGGPSALACGAVNPGEVEEVLLVSGCAPVERMGALLDTGPIDALLGVASRWLPRLAGVAVGAMGEVARRLPAVAAGVWEADLLPHERKVVHGIGATDRRDELEAFTEALREGPMGVVDDYRLISQPWDFLPEEVEVPVVQWHGSADSIVPLRDAAELRARLPRSELRVVADAGHLLLHTQPRLILGAIPG